MPRCVSHTHTHTHTLQPKRNTARAVKYGAHTTHPPEQSQPASGRGRNARATTGLRGTQRSVSRCADPLAGRHCFWQSVSPARTRTLVLEYWYAGSQAHASSTWLALLHPSPLRPTTPCLLCCTEDRQAQHPRTERNPRGRLQSSSARTYECAAVVRRACTGYED